MALSCYFLQYLVTRVTLQRDFFTFLWQAVLDVRKAAELWSAMDRNPRPEQEVEREASDHSSLDEAAQREDSTQSQTARSNSFSAVAWYVCGTTLAEYTSLPNEAQCRTSLREFILTHVILAPGARGRGGLSSSG